jgi:hypothetical protein
MSSNIPSIDSEEYRIVKENRMARTLAVRRGIRDNIDIQYYNDYCDKLKDMNFDYNPINSIRILVAEMENLRDDIDEKNALHDLIRCQCLKTVTDVIDNVTKINNYVERIFNVVETIVSNEKAFIIHQENLDMEIASLKQRQKEEYYDIRRYLLLFFLIVIPLFPFFKK